MKAINMVEETASFFYNHYTKIKKVGLLATSATILNDIDDNYWFYYPDPMLKFKKTYYI